MVHDGAFQGGVPVPPASDGEALQKMGIPWGQQPYAFLWSFPASQLLAYLKQIASSQNIVKKNTSVYISWIFQEIKYRTSFTEKITIELQLGWAIPGVWQQLHVLNLELIVWKLPESLFGL